MKPLLLCNILRLFLRQHDIGVASAYRPIVTGKFILVSHHLYEACADRDPAKTSTIKTS